MMKIRLIVLSAAAIVAAACTVDTDEPVRLVNNELEQQWSHPDVVGNTLCVKLDRETADALSITRTRSGEWLTGNETFDDICSRYDIQALERVFEPNECEPRLRKAGLDLWYNIILGDDTDNVQLASELMNIAFVQHVEPARRVYMANHTARYATEAELEALTAAGESTRADGSAPFNDPLLPEQWMLINNGTIGASKAGADINVKDAWTKCKGNPNVIVAVVDTGIDYLHPDLAGNMWSDIGRNFSSTNAADGTKAITFGNHGTHVAGTIAAVSNNGVGISGIAGGDGKPNTGVKIMCCQIFQTEDSGSGGYQRVANAIRFAADHGAVICQNSWGYKYQTISTEEDFTRECLLVKDAIDYFIKYAGMSPDGETQTGPVAGGVVLFAAGNDGLEQKEYPASYGPCISVAALSYNYRKAVYSTYNENVKLCAPGGGGWDWLSDEQYRYACWNLSTFPRTLQNNTSDQSYRVHATTGYGWLMGTSMACPHASGVAALIASYCGGPGFTADELKRLLLESARDVSGYQTNMSCLGRIGKLVDADAALSLGKPGSGNGGNGGNGGGSVADGNKPEVSFYPNPCTDKLNILFTPSSESGVLSTNGHVSLRNSVGVVVFDADVRNMEYGKAITLDVSNLNSGRYTMDVDYVCGGTSNKATQTIIKK